MTGHHPHIVCPHNQYTPQRPILLSVSTSNLTPSLCVHTPNNLPPQRALPYWTSQLPNNWTLICFIPTKMHVCIFSTSLGYSSTLAALWSTSHFPVCFSNTQNPLYSPPSSLRKHCTLCVYIQAEIFVCILVYMCTRVHSPLGNSTSV